jgi:hypothetical protein
MYSASTPSNKRPGDPVRIENGDDAVAGPDPPDPLAHGGNLAGAVGKRDKAGLGGGLKGAGEDHHVARVETGGAHAHQHLSMPGLRHRRVAQHHIAGAAEALDPIGFHRPPCVPLKTSTSLYNYTVSWNRYWHKPDV